MLRLFDYVVGVRSGILSSTSSQDVSSAYGVLETALKEDRNNSYIFNVLGNKDNIRHFLQVLTSHPERFLLAMPQKLSRHVPFAVFRNKCQIISNTDVIIAETLHIQTAELIFQQNNNNKNETLNFQFNHAKIYKSNLV